MSERPETIKLIEQQRMRSLCVNIEIMICLLHFERQCVGFSRLFRRCPIPYLAVEIEVNTRLADIPLRRASSATFAPEASVRSSGLL